MGAEQQLEPNWNGCGPQPEPLPGLTSGVGSTPACSPDRPNRSGPETCASSSTLHPPPPPPALEVKCPTVTVWPQRYLTQEFLKDPSLYFFKWLLPFQAAAAACEALFFSMAPLDLGTFSLVDLWNLLLILDAASRRYSI